MFGYENPPIGQNRFQHVQIPAALRGHRMFLRRIALFHVPFLVAVSHFKFQQGVLCSSVQVLNGASVLAHHLFAVLLRCQ